MNQATPFPLRMPEEMRSFFKEKSIENSRSLNGEIIYTLKQEMNKDKNANCGKR